MRSLIVTALLALALPTAFAVNICPEGSVGSSSFSTTIDTFAPGEEYTAVGCNINGEVSLNGRSTPSNTSAPISIKVEDSAIYGYLQIWLPYQENVLNTTAPFYVTIQNNVFQNDAMIYFYSSLPPDSWITFQGNQMSGNATQYWIEGVIPIMVNIVFFQNTTFNIVDNTIRFTQNSPNDSPYLIYVTGSNVEGSGNATLNILRNTITSNGTNSVSLIFINYWNTGDNSTLRVDSNTLIATNTAYNAKALVLGSITGGSSSSVSLSSNVVEVSAGGDNSVGVIYLPTVQIGSFHIDQNTITTNALHFIQCYDSTFAPLYASIRGNTFDSTNSSITTPVIAIDAYDFTNATLVVASNTVTAPSVTTTDTPLLYIDYPVIEGSASIVYCGNSLPWAMVNATAEQLFSSNVIEILSYDPIVCIAPTTTTTTTTTSTTSMTTSTSALATTTATDVTATTQSIPSSSTGTVISTTSAAGVCLLLAFAVLL